MAEQQAGRVSVEYDVVFGTGGDRDLRCNIYRPPQQSTGRPAVLLVHGGGWVRGDRSQLHGYGILLGRHGYVCVATEYRLATESHWPAQLHDVKAALRWMRANAGHLGIDPQKIAVSGNSAGGHLALMLAATQNLPEFEGEGRNPGAGTQIGACVAFYAPAQLFGRTDRDTGYFDFLFGPGYDESTARAASPITYASNTFPPTMLVHGNKDELVPVDSSLMMYKALSDQGAAAELHIYEGAPHAFDAVREYGRQCASIIELFLDRHVANPRPVPVPPQASTV